MSSEEILKDVYTLDIPGLARHRNPDPVIEETSSDNPGASSTTANMPMVGEGQNLDTQGVETRAPIQGETHVARLSTIYKDPVNKLTMWNSP